MNNDIIASIRAAMPAAQVHLADRMALVRAEYIATDLDERLSVSLDALLRTLISRKPIEEVESQAARNETRSIVVVGEAGAGKSAALNHAFQTHPVLGGYGTLGSGCPIARVVVPAPCSLKSLGIAILNGLGYPLMRDLRENAVWTRVHEALQISGTVILHLDEMHNLTDKANIKELDAIRKALKGLMISREWPVGLVVSGLPSLVPAMRVIDEVRRRGRFISIPLLSMPDDEPLLEEAMKRCCEIAGVELPEGFANEIGPRLSHASLHRYGIAVEFVHEAIEDCLLGGGGALRIAHFANAYAARTGCGDRMSPFIAPDWAEIDASQVLLDEMPPEIVIPEDPKPRKRGRPSKKGS
jgi:type II secretory pathway predicted ATPase ExeA